MLSVILKPRPGHLAAVRTVSLPASSTFEEIASSLGVRALTYRTFTPQPHERLGSLQAFLSAGDTIVLQY
jgi:hypothetical protein